MRLRASSAPEVTPWCEAWGPELPQGDPEPPSVMPPSGMACYRCPGADDLRCCAHGEWRDVRYAHLRTAAEVHPTTSGRRGRRRRWWRSLLTNRLDQLEENR